MRDRNRRPETQQDRDDFAEMLDSIGQSEFANYARSCFRRGASIRTVEAGIETVLKTVRGWQIGRGV